MVPSRFPLHFDTVANLARLGERVGTFSLVTASLRDAHAAVSQLKFLVRGMYSFAPIHGAGIAAIVMNDGKLNAEWYSS